MRLVLVAAAALVMLVPTPLARAHDPARYPDMSRQELEWFRSQMSPKGLGPCCDERDGTYAEEDIRGERYWTRWDMHGVTTDWVEVPDDVVIRDPNRHGAPVVWWTHNNGKPVIRCYAPGGGV